MIQQFSAHHCQEDPSRFLETTSEGERPFGGLASRGCASRLANTLGGETSVPIGKRAARQSSGIQHRRQPIPFGGEESITPIGSSTSDSLGPIRTSLASCVPYTYRPIACSMSKQPDFLVRHLPRRATVRKSRIARKSLKSIC